MKKKLLVHHGNTHPLGAKCKFCDNVKKEKSMSKAQLLREFDKKFNLPKKPKFVCDDLICGYKARKFLSQALGTMREEGWQTGYQQCKEDKEGLK